MTLGKRIAQAAPAIARDLTGLAGAAAIVAGVTMLSVAGALIIGGCLTISVAVLWARSG